jgi:hypothetical protein
VATSYWAVGRGVAKVFDDFDDARQYSYTAATKKKAVVAQEAYSFDVVEVKEEVKVRRR